MKYIKALVFVLIVAFLMSVAAPAFGVRPGKGQVVEGKSYRVVTNKIAFSGSDSMWIKPYGRWYGAIFQQAGTESYYAFGVRDGRVTIISLPTRYVKVVIVKGAARPTAKFYLNDTGEVERAVITANPRALFWAPEPFIPY